jgi:hypothetical protein
MSVPSTSIERTRNVTLGIMGSDVEDAPADLALEVEYKAPGGDFQHAGDATFDTDHWNVTFTPSVDAMLGLYDIRARLKDHDGDYSDYFYKNSTIEVINCRPVVTDLIPDMHTVLRGKNVSLMVNGYDAEDQNPDLVVEIQYLGPSGQWTDLDAPTFADNQWTVIFSPGLDAALGNYSFRASLTDSSSAQGDWTVMNGTVEVLNNRPVISAVQTDQTALFRTQTLLATIKGSDLEDQTSELTVEAQLSPHGKAAWSTEGIGTLELDQGKDGWTLPISPSAHFTPGSYDLRVRLTDHDGGVGDWFVPAAQISILNGPPVLDLKQPLIINEGQAATFDASGSKDPEGGALTFSWDFGDGKTGDGERPTHTFATFGTYDLKLTATDLDGALTMKNYSVRVNGLPAGDVKTQQGAGVQNYNVKFNSKGMKDPEGTGLTYKWDFDTRDGSGVDSTDANPSHNYGKPGTYEWQVTITDANGGTTVKTGTVTVSAMSQFTLGLIVILVVIIAVVVVAAVLLMRRKRKRPAVGVVPPKPVSSGPSMSLLDADNL